MSSAAKHAEYKQVTVLFADVVHSMDIAAAVGPERLREIMADVFDRSVAVVRRYEGTVDKFTGDGIMALFGAPIALEDHALRACMAALEIQAESAKLAVEVGNRDGIELQLRVGLNSGQVIAGEIGSATASYTAIGEQVGMAQRMESAAPAGGVMLSESTARLVENLVPLDRSATGRHQGRGARFRRGGCWRSVNIRPAGAATRRSSGAHGNLTPLPRCSMRRSAAPDASSPSSARRESARAVSSAKPRQTRPAAVSRCSPHTANRIPPTSPSTWSHG